VKDVRTSEGDRRVHSVSGALKTSGEDHELHLDSINKVKINSIRGLFTTTGQN